MSKLHVDLQPRHKISPYLYMQFMEPLGTADPSVDTAWDFVENDWKPEAIDKIRELAPTMVRFGGCFASYYHWREAVGPYASRVPMVNYYWGGIYHNLIGTHELIDFCRRVNADPLIVVNMESDGSKTWAYPKNGTVRLGTDTEAAEWVAYCNDPANAERIRNGSPEPFNVKYWQIGNETSYATGGFTSDEAVEVTKRFVDKMRAADPSISLIGWGDKGCKGKEDETWCRKMSSVDGIDMVAFHHHFGSGLPNSPLVGTKYRDDPDLTWEHLMNAYKSLERNIARMRADIGTKRLAMTEGHFALPGRYRNEVLSSWGAGVAYARCLNVIMRNSDVIDVATMADFFGNVWQVNAVMIPSPAWYGKPYLQPVGSVMSLFCKHQGERALDITVDDAALDVTASVTGDTVYLHVANTDMHGAKELSLDLGGREIASVSMTYIASDPTVEITQSNHDVFTPVTVTLDPRAPITVPAAAVAAVEVRVG